MTDKARDTKRSESEIQSKIDSFPEMPAMCGYLLSKIKDPNLDFAELADKVKYDPGMTANLLKLANSAYFGARGQVDSVQSAIVRLGIVQVFQMVTALASSKFLKRELKGYDLSTTELLRHSVWVAIAAGDLAASVGVQAADIFFTAGLLHDIGKVPLDELVGSNTTELRDEMDNAGSGASFEKIEKEFFGMNHPEAGARILDKWLFPELLVSAVRWHHDPGHADDMFKDVASMVHIADVLAYSQGIGTGVDGLHYELSEAAVDGLALKHSVIEGVASRTLDKMQEIEEILQ